MLNLRHIRQTNPEGRNSCVPACLSMVLEHQGVMLDQRVLSDWLGTQPAGTEVWNVLLLEQRVAGCQVQLGSISFTELQASLASDVPPIVFVNTRHLSTWERDTIHAVVVVMITDDEVAIHDPAFPHAPSHLPRREFAMAWGELDFLAATVRVIRA